MIRSHTIVLPLSSLLSIIFKRLVEFLSKPKTWSTIYVCCVSSDLPNTHGLAVDWVSRNLFWTSYDANKKQINVARLDGSFKNAVIQGLDKPHCLVMHPMLGSVPHTHTHENRKRLLIKLSDVETLSFSETAVRHIFSFTLWPFLPYMGPYWTSSTCGLYI